MNRRHFVIACPLALLVGCGNTVNVPLDVSNIADAIVGALTKYAPPDLAAKLTAAYAEIMKGGSNWKASLRALVDVANAVLALGVVPEPAASYARVALGGLALFLPLLAGAARSDFNQPSAYVVTIEQARGAAEMLRGLR